MLLVAAQCHLAALSVCSTRPALHGPVVSRAARRVVCAEAEAESDTDEGRESGVRGARIIGFAGGAAAGGCANLKLLPNLNPRYSLQLPLHSATWELLLEQNVVEPVPISKARLPAHRTPPHRP